MNAAATSIIDLNLLPAADRPMEIRGRAAVIAAAFVIAILGVVPLAVQAQRMEARAASMERRADEAQAQLRTIQVEFTQARARRIEIDDAGKRAAALTAERASLQQGTRPLHEDLAMIFGWGFLPPGARITRVSGQLNAFRVEGTGAAPLDVIAYAENLQSDGGFASARMASYAPGAEGGVFTVEVMR